MRTLQVLEGLGGEHFLCKNYTLQKYLYLSKPYVKFGTGFARHIVELALGDQLVYLLN
jgi:hypothetical protein